MREKERTASPKGISRALCHWCVSEMPDCAPEGASPRESGQCKPLAETLHEDDVRVLQANSCVEAAIVREKG
jgi:hypothetical protein